MARLCTALAASVLLMSSLGNAQNAAEEKTKCYDYADGHIGLRLCMNQVDTRMAGITEVAVVSGVLYNTGKTPVCEVKMDILDIDKAISKFPSSLPSLPGSFDVGEKFAFSTTIPVDPEAHVIPYADVWSSFYPCESEKVEGTIDGTQGNNGGGGGNPPTSNDDGETGGATDFSQFLNEDTQCFLTCYAEVVMNNGGDENIQACPALNYVFTHNCHTCDSFVVTQAKIDCVDLGCTTEQCQTKSKWRTSGATKTTTALLTGTVAAGLAAYASS